MTVSLDRVPSSPLTVLTLAAGRRRKGLLVEIGYDNKVINKEMLRAWERGHYGEIFS